MSVTISRAMCMSNIRSSELPEMSLLRRMNALIWAKASSIGFKLGEYGGRYSMRTPANIQYRIYQVKQKNKMHQNSLPAPKSHHHGESGHYPLQARSMDLDKLCKGASVFQLAVSSGESERIDVIRTTSCSRNSR